MKLLTARAAGVLADTINDANSTRKVYLLAAGLAVLGLILIAITVWFWRSTRHDPELLAPLEVLGDRKFRKLAGSDQRQLLDSTRPNDVKPVQWGVERGAASDDPALTASAFDVALVVVEEGSGQSAEAAPDTVAPVDPHSDLDSILAAAGAVVPGRPAAGAGSAVPAASTDAAVPGNGVAVTPGEAAAVAAFMAADPAGEGSAAEPSTGGGDVKPAASADGARASAPVPSPEPAVAPLLIVPVDHDLRPSVSRTIDPVGAKERDSDPADDRLDYGAADGEFDHDEDHDDHLDDDPDDHLDDDLFDDDRDELAGLTDDDADGADDDADPTASIDPLLRMFNRNDT